MNERIELEVEERVTKNGKPYFSVLQLNLTLFPRSEFNGKPQPPRAFLNPRGPKPEQRPAEQQPPTHRELRLAHEAQRPERTVDGRPFDIPDFVA